MSIDTPRPRELLPSEANIYVDIRREMLLDSPWAFLSSPGDDIGSDAERVAARIAEPENAILVIDDPKQPDRLVACAGVARSPRLKCRHRASIWGVYARPDVRGKGFGRTVVDAAIRTAWSWPGVEVIGLSASTKSPRAIAVYESLGFEGWGIERDAMRIDGVSYDEVYLQLRRKAE